MMLKSLTLCRDCICSDVYHYSLFNWLCNDSTNRHKAVSFHRSVLWLCQFHWDNWNKQFSKRHIMREILVSLPVGLTWGKKVYFSIMLLWLRVEKNVAMSCWIFLIQTVQTEGEPHAWDANIYHHHPRWLWWSYSDSGVQLNHQCSRLQWTLLHFLVYHCQ